MKSLKTGRETISQRAVKRLTSGLLSMAFLIALPVLATSKVNAQVECLGACEEQYEACVRNSGDNPAPSGGCQATYEACVDACLGGSVAIFD
jgi:hypothetical protein